MLLSDLLTPHRIRIPIQGGDKASVLAELVGLLGNGNGTDPRELLSAVEEREALLSTGIGFGVATPHGKSPHLTTLEMAAGVSPDPITYGALDGEPVRLFFLLLGPESAASDQVKALGRIARLVRHDGFRRRLVEARSPDEFLQTLRDAERP